MVSFDVTSLFTNVPLDYTIDIILDRIYRKKEIDLAISEKDLKKLLNLCTKENVFMFDGNLYQQVDGVAMGSPLGPLLANIFMANVEDLFFKSSLNSGIASWTRFVDDIFVIFDSINPNIDNILKFLNNIHPNILFTVERESEHRLQFLDVFIEFSNGRFITSTYKKPTSTGLYVMWDSFTPLCFKMATIKSLFDRSFRICSTTSLLVKEKLQLIHDFHNKLDFPLHVLYNVYDKCFTRFHGDKLVKFGPTKQKVYISLPYIGHVYCKKVKRLLHDVIAKNKCLVDLKIVFVNKYNIGSLFKFKDKLSRDLTSHVVYGLRCMDCQAEYFGCTTRLLPVRVQEHKHALKGVRTSALADHMFQTGHNIDWDGVKILARNSNELNLFYTESLLITRFKPVLNKMQTSVNLNLFN
jgi:hypothetical protein